MAIAFNPDLADWETQRVIHHSALEQLGFHRLPDFVVSVDSYEGVQFPLPDYQCYDYTCPLCYHHNPVPNMPLRSVHFPEAVPTPASYREAITCESEPLASPGIIPAALRGRSIQDWENNRAPLKIIKRDTVNNKSTNKRSRMSRGLSTRVLKSKDPKKQSVGGLAGNKLGPSKKKVGAGVGEESVLPSMYMDSFPEHNADFLTRHFSP
jgi:hypothetical protein